ncbi:papilin b, proteoglycan-like sulfated glycoprotein [Pungitius pungitius]|uniref:papilin b, proteoglycan-like sulfated glycoprotein n=1 Tax=Pungitius pungitius TaxID=134920 RepID=UPI002E13FBE0
MNVLQVLGLLQLLAVPAFALRWPTHDHWGQFGAYGPCSRTCGTGVATRTRTCITSRTDGGHNCVGSSKSFRTCNIQECPFGSRDFREEQCSQFDRADFQSKSRTWVPFYGASNPCELSCVPRGENFFYRHRGAVVDGTPCYVGRTDICVEGICRILTHEEFTGLDGDANTAHSAAAAPPPKETLTYVYKTGVYGQCSASCDEGTQHRSVECWVEDRADPRVVEESHCIAQRLQRPRGQQACNMQPCGAEYRVSSFGACSVTCGEGQQTRGVTCVGSRGERLANQACKGLAKPPSVQACHRPACYTHVTWHVTDFGQCTRSCSGGVRERRVGCFDMDLNPYPEARCGTATKPLAVETCNAQPCPRAQMVESVQKPRTRESTVKGFVPHVPEDPSASRWQTNIASPPVLGPHCAQSSHGCCPDGQTSATGPQNQGCAQDDCVGTRYGCCLDGVTAARGFGRAGCSEQQTAVQHTAPSTLPSSGNVCSMPRDEGPCDNWKVRFYFDSGTGKCTEFWYGSCHGNANNFVSLEACQRECGNVMMTSASHKGTHRRKAQSSALRAQA